MNYTKIGLIKQMVSSVIDVAGFYLLWITIHFVAAQLYPLACSPPSITGFLMSPFLVETPWCKGLRWIIGEGANVIQTMWIVLGTWFCSKLLRKKTREQVDDS